MAPTTDPNAAYKSITGRDHPDAAKFKSDGLDGFDDSGRLTVRDGGMLPWTQRRKFDPAAYNVADMDNRLRNASLQASQADRRASPLADPTQSNQVRGQQMTLAQQL